MNILKKILAISLVVLMTFTLGLSSITSVSALTKTQGTITLPENTTWTGYKILNAELVLKDENCHTQESSHSNTCFQFKWSINPNYQDSLEAIMKDITKTTYHMNEEQILQAVFDFVMPNGIENYENADKLARELTLVATNAELRNISGGYSTPLDYGYWLFVEQFETENYPVDGESFARSRSLLRTIGFDDVVIKNSKRSYPEFAKYIKSDDAYTPLTNIIDKGTGDEVEFVLHVKLPNDATGYNAYYINITDDYGEVLVPSIDSLVITGANGLTINYEEFIYYDITVTQYSDQHKFVIIIPNALIFGSNEDLITIEYTALLSSNYSALTNDWYTTNYASLKASNDIYFDYESNKNSPESLPLSELPRVNSQVVTYNLIINKVRDDGKSISGAEFKLQKQDSSGRYQDVSYILEKSAKDGINNSVFTFKMLDEGYYKLIETSSPTNYIGIGEIEFTLSANVFEDWSGPSVDLNFVKSNSSNTDVTVSSIDNSTGTITLTVMNHFGASLPNTGGIGVFGGYAIGAGLITLAIIILVINKLSKKATQD